MIIRLAIGLYTGHEARRVKKGSVRALGIKGVVKPAVAKSVNIQNRDTSRGRHYPNDPVNIEPTGQFRAQRYRRFPRQCPPYVCEVPLKDRAYVTVTCQNKTWCALIDTGASKCLLSEEMYNSLPDKPGLSQSDIPNFRVANNGTMPTRGLVTLPIRIGNHVMDVKLYVVSNLCNDIILGRDHLGACKAQIDYSKNVVRFDLKEGLFTVSDTVLLPGEEKHVRVRLRSRQRALTTRTVVVPRRNDNRIPDLVGNRQNVKLSGGKTCILMHNRGNKPMHLRKDLKVAISSQDKRLSQLLSQVAPYDNRRKPLENSPERIRLYKEAIDSIPLENTVLNPAETEEVKKLVWTHRDALSVNNELGCLRGYEHSWHRLAGSSRLAS